MTKIHAWIYDPTKALLVTKKSKAKCHVVSCSLKGTCKVRKQTNHCLMQSVGIGHVKCKYGSLSTSTGYTPKAQNFYSWIKKQERLHRDIIGQLTAGSPPKRIFEIGEYWYLPHNFMVKKKFSVAISRSQTTSSKKQTLPRISLKKSLQQNRMLNLAVKSKTIKKKQSPNFSLTFLPIHPSSLIF